MPNENAKSCWEYWDCQIKKDCPAFQNDAGKDCYNLASHNCPRIHQDNPNMPRVDRGFKFCWECPWFKKINPDFGK